MSSRNYFKVLCEIDSFEGIDNLSTFHFSNERESRHNKIATIIGEGKCIGYFLVDRNHKDGDEVHCVYDNGIVVIYNERKRSIVTELIARPAQIYRYWNGLNEVFPRKYQYIINKAKHHQLMGYNNDW